MISPAPQPILPSGLAGPVVAQVDSGTGTVEGGSVDPKPASHPSFLTQLLASTTAGKGAKAPKPGLEGVARPLPYTPEPIEQPTLKAETAPPLLSARLLGPSAQEVAGDTAEGPGEGEQPAQLALLPAAPAALVAPADAEGDIAVEFGKALPLQGELLPRTKPVDLREGEASPTRLAFGSAGGEPELQPGEAENQPLGSASQSQTTLPSAPPIAPLLTGGSAPKVKITDELPAGVSDDAAIPEPGRETGFAPRPEPDRALSFTPNTQDPAPPSAPAPKKAQALPGAPSLESPARTAPASASAAPETVQPVLTNAGSVTRVDRAAAVPRSMGAVAAARPRGSSELTLAADATDRAPPADMTLREADALRGSPVPAVTAQPSVSLPSAAPSISATAPSEPSLSAPAPAPVLAGLSAATASAQTPVNLSPNAPALSSDLAEQVASQIADAREASRSLRPELTVRHSEFGTVAMRIEPGTTSATTSAAAAPAAASAALSDWRATLSARDPGFVPAVQAALADRSVQAASESGLLQSGLSQQGQSQSGALQRSQDQGTGTNAFNAQANAGFGSAAGGGSEPRYGSSPGGLQGPAQPYSGEEGDGGSRRTAANSDDAQSSGAGDARGGALFA